jgi:hypothetical protein
MRFRGTEHRGEIANGAVAVVYVENSVTPCSDDADTRDCGDSKQGKRN